MILYSAIRPEENVNGVNSQLFKTGLAFVLIHSNSPPMIVSTFIYMVIYIRTLVFVLQFFPMKTHHPNTYQFALEPSSLYT